MTGPATAALELRDVAKSFGAVQALRSGSLVVDSGSIHALVGENGAGKSTLVKIVAGVHQRDAGTFRFHGEDVDFGSTAESKAAGIAVIYQEPTLFPDLSVTENIFMGRQPLGTARRIDRAAMYAEATELFTRLGVAIDPRRPARGLSIADQQIIEIAKAISLDASLLVMDEPTAALSGVEVDRLFAVARSLRDEGRALVFISHRFDEVFALCDTVTVMRDGEYVSTDAVADTSVDEIVAAHGRPRGRRPVPQDRGRGRRRGARRRRPLQPRHLPRRLLLRAGRRDRRPGRPGRRRPQRDRAGRLRRRQVRRRQRPAGRAATCPATDPRAAIRAGIAFVPEDRRKQGLVTESSVARNVAGVIRRRLTHAGLLTNADENRAAGPWAGRLEVKTNALDAHATTMSGGNQQKVVLAKWLATEPKLLIIDEPTRGIDVGTKAEVHRLLSDLAGRGDGHPDDLLRAARGARHVRPGPRRLRGPDHRRADRDDATPEAVMHAATASVTHTADRAEAPA